MNPNYSKVYNYPYYNSINQSQNNIKGTGNDERLIGGGFLGPFILGGITGGLVSPFFYGGYNRPVYYYQPGPYRPPYYGPRPF